MEHLIIWIFISLTAIHVESYKPSHPNIVLIIADDVGKTPMKALIILDMIWKVKGQVYW